MSYLHVTIKKKNADDWVCIFTDLSVAELKKNLIKPYRLGKPIYFDGNILPPNEISKIQITETDKSHEEELKIVQDESYRKVEEFNSSGSGVTLISVGHGYNDFEINECGAEVTNKYITGGPGTGTPLTAIAEFIKHPWVVGVGGGLLLVAVTAYLGLR
jgi:hypothetical protein